MGTSVVSRRLKQALVVQKVSPADLARSVGITPGYVSKILSGAKSNLSAEIAHKMAEALRCSTAWLTGQESEDGNVDQSFPSDVFISHGHAAAPDDVGPLVTGKQRGLWQRIRLIPVVSYVQGGQAIDFEAVPSGDHNIVPSTCRDPKAFALILRGISMEPYYCENDVVIVSPAKEKRLEGLVVAQLAGVGVTFKLLDVPSAKGMIRLAAYNPAFLPIERPEEDFDWVHAVHSVIKYERP